MAVTATDPSTIVPEPPGPAPDRAPDWVASGTPEPLRSRLVAALGADRVLTRALDLIRYASDASAYRLIPQAVAVPRDVSDMAALLRCATELGLSGALAAVAALQQVTGRPYESLVLALETLTRV